MMERKTVFSPCRKYRYTLWRGWDGGLFDDVEKDEACAQAYVQFIGLNPSTADETKDDPTIRRCRAFAQAWGYNWMCMTNLFAFRATDPKKMMKHPQPDGERSFCSYMVGDTRQFSKRNDAFLYEIAQGASLIVAAWGTKGDFLGRDKEVLELLKNVHCIRKTDAGFPEHPLYLPKTLVPIPLE